MGKVVRRSLMHRASLWSTVGEWVDFALKQGTGAAMTEVERASAWQFWIDRGGTFTDVVARTPEGAIRVHKLLSDNPEQYDDAALEGIRQLLRLAPDEPIPASAIEAIKMGTTVATNALLERRGEPTTLAITAGLGDALRIGYQHRPDIFARHIVLPEMLYTDVVEIDERVRADGTVERPIDLRKARRIWRRAWRVAGARSPSS